VAQVEKTYLTCHQCSAQTEVCALGIIGNQRLHTMRAVLAIESSGTARNCVDLPIREIREERAGKTIVYHSR
jgi:hypothetical protein